MSAGTLIHADLQVRKTSVGIIQAVLMQVYVGAGAPAEAPAGAELPPGINCQTSPTGQVSPFLQKHCIWCT